ncbi:hypothetical protein MOV08_32920 [Streptomyces yunnanensis]|uniref:DUF6542 domain-containing protein n=1 Tax=Streptomyces yunnanensis TaxID=156453 RepID=A0ABY8AFK3_9ACTN|nr:DUF6542 domain-containing protein [Streptomyces yunnanensis]WEB43608.1 hypothetical protein MOV08_32920 [Streptomyces yunnanensis]
MSRQVPGPRRRGTQGLSPDEDWSYGYAVQDGTRSARVGRADRRGRAGSATLVALVLAIAGALADMAIASRPGWVFAVTAALGAALAAKACTRAGAWWLISAPPLVVAMITAACEQVAGTTSVQGKGLTTTAVRWAVDGFPAMAAAETVLTVVLVARLVGTRRQSGRNGSRRNSGA